MLCVSLMLGDLCVAVALGSVIWCGYGRLGFDALCVDVWQWCFGEWSRIVFLQGIGMRPLELEGVQCRLWRVEGCGVVGLVSE